MMPRFAQAGNVIINLELITRAIYFPTAINEDEERESLLIVFFVENESPQKFLADAAEELWRILKNETFVYIFDKW